VSSKDRAEWPEQDPNVIPEFPATWPNYWQAKLAQNLTKEKESMSSTTSPLGQEIAEALERFQAIKPEELRAMFLVSNNEESDDEFPVHLSVTTFDDRVRLEWVDDEGAASEDSAVMDPQRLMSLGLGLVKFAKDLIDRNGAQK
jgi:hypothetical protein